METDRDIWFYFAVLVSAVALFVWAFWAVTDLGGAWIPWAVMVLLALASGSLALHVKTATRATAWTPELRQAEIQLGKRLAREVPRNLLFVLGTVVIVRLAHYDLLPEWAGAVLLLALLAAWVFLKQSLRRSRV
ncbi:MAG: hypothetical protein QOH93_1990 [Chloroflexia bacterium]|jgi:Ca2+/Na+ antiporter|nr:hypothetical protein [Chloroflexia bacterium]